LEYGPSIIHITLKTVSDKMTNDKIVEMALMAGNVYFKTRHDNNKIPIPNGWGLMGERKFNPASGFEAAAFKKGNEIVISFAGTNSGHLGEGTAPDINADLTLGAGLIHSQLLECVALYKEVKAQFYKESADKNIRPNITFTGHSLGGGLAALMAIFFDLPAVTFDPAPFALAANMQNKKLIASYIEKLGYFPPDIALDLFESSIEKPGVDRTWHSIRGEKNIISFATQGEVLSSAGTLGGILGARRIGAITLIKHGTPDFTKQVDLLTI
jgi:hypothetical protein